MPTPLPEPRRHLLYVGPDAAADRFVALAAEHGFDVTAEASMAAALRLAARYARVFDAVVFERPSPPTLGAPGDPGPPPDPFATVAPHLPVLHTPALAPRPDGGPEACEGRIEHPDAAWRLLFARLAARFAPAPLRGAVHRTSAAHPDADPDRRARCWAARTLAHVVSPTDGHEPAAWRHAWHVQHRLAALVPHLPLGVTLTLRLHARRPGDPDVGLALLVTAAGPDAPAADRRLRDALDALDGALGLDGTSAPTPYAFRVVDSAGELARWRLPLLPRHAVRLSPVVPAHDAPTDDLDAFNGPIADADADADELHLLDPDEAPGAAPALWDVPDVDAARVRHLADLYAHLASTPAATVLDVSLEPVDFDDALRARAHAHAFALAEQAPDGLPVAAHALALARGAGRVLRLDVAVFTDADALPPLLLPGLEALLCTGFSRVAATPVPPAADDHVLRLPHRPASLEGATLPSVAAPYLLLPLPTAAGVPGVPHRRAADDFAPPALPDHGVRLGTAPTGQVVRLPLADLRRHLYAIGATGSGKTTFLASLAHRLADAGEGLVLVDPHGDLADRVLEALPAHRAADVVVFDPVQPDSPWRLNPLEGSPSVPGSRSFAIDELLALFDEWYDMKTVAGPMFESYFRAGCMLVMAQPGPPGTLLDLARVFRSAHDRERWTTTCTDEETRDFWTQAARVTGEAALQNMAPYVLGKISPFLSHDVLRRLVDAPRTTLDLAALMDHGRILVVRLPKGHLGPVGVRLVGSVLVARLVAAALARHDRPAADRRPVTLLVDEAQNFVSARVASLLAETRKYGLSAVLANQSLAQMPPDLREAILANCGSLLVFRPGIPDADRLLPYTTPLAAREALVSLPTFTCVARLLAHGQPLPPFYLRVDPPGARA